VAARRDTMKYPPNLRYVTLTLPIDSTTGVTCALIVYLATDPPDWAVPLREAYDIGAETSLATYPKTDYEDAFNPFDDDLAGIASSARFFLGDPFEPRE
jgi:hypothetical protein